MEHYCCFVEYNCGATTTFTKSYYDAANKFDDVLVFLKTIDDEIILEEHGAPYTPRRFPEWRRN